MARTVRHRTAILFVFLFDFLFLFALAASAQQYSFRHYGAVEGLQNLVILSLTQDGAGYLWAGSESGLYRYDGTRFRLMGAAEGLPCTTEVHTLHTATDGAVWVNTCKQFFRFDGQRFHAVPGLNGMQPGVQAVADDAAGRVLIAAQDGLYEVSVSSQPDFFSVRRHLLGAGREGQMVRGILRHGSELWFGCGQRLCLEGAAV